MKLKQKTVRTFENVYDSAGTVLKSIETIEVYEDDDKEQD